MLSQLGEGGLWGWAWGDAFQVLLITPKVTHGGLKQGVEGAEGEVVVVEA